MRRFDGELLQSRFVDLPKWKRIGFILLLCERMIPNLIKFGYDTGFDISNYLKLIALGWESLNELRNGTDYKNLSEISFADAPNTEEFVHRFTSLALNAALSVSSLMSIVDDGRIEHAVEAAQLACDGVELYIQFLESVPPIPLARSKVLDHPLMQRELACQESDLEFLISLPGHGGNVARSLLKQRAQHTPPLIPVEM
jgi:uncharacterized protein YjaG (DUF416 family)